MGKDTVISMNSSNTTNNNYNNNNEVKWMILAAFVVVNGALLVSLRSAVVFSNPNTNVVASTEVLSAEVLKLIFSLILSFIFDANWNFSTFKSILHSTISDDLSSDFVKLSVPSILYIIQNNLQYIIETRIIFMVLYQSKIITTALFYSNMLSRRIHHREWSAIGALLLGVCIVEACQPDVEGHYHASYPFGIASVFIAILTSGFAGVYFEKILKSSKSSVWVINVQLSTLSCIFGTVACLTQNTVEIDKHGFFAGYNTYTVMVITLQASVGLLVALVVKYADNIHKGFASSLSVVISGVTDVFLFKDMSIDQPFLTGTLIVLASSLVFVVHSVRQQSKSISTHPPLQTPFSPTATSTVDYKPSVSSASVSANRIGGYTVTNRKPIGIESTPSKKDIPISDRIDDDSESEIVSVADSSDRGTLSRNSSGYNLPYAGIGRAAVAGAVGSIGPYVLSASHMLESTIYRPKSSKNLTEDENPQDV